LQSYAFHACKVGKLVTEAGKLVTNAQKKSPLLPTTNNKGDLPRN